MSAAIGLRKTSSSSTIRIGKAISSPLSSESSDASLSARTSGARPDSSVLTGGLTWSQLALHGREVSSEICSSDRCT